LTTAQSNIVFSDDFTNSGCAVDYFTPCVPNGWTFSGDAGHYGIEDLTEAGGVPSNYPELGKPALFLDTYGGMDAYFQSSFFFMPRPGTLSLLVWGHYDSVSLSIEIVVQNSVSTLETLDPPKAQFGQLPISRSYSLNQFAGQSIAIRLECTSQGMTGTICDYDDIVVSATGSGSQPVTVSPVISAGSKIAGGVVGGVMAEIVGRGIVGPLGLRLIPGLAGESAGAFFVPVIAGSLVSSAVDVALQNSVPDYNTRFAISTAAGLLATAAIVGGIALTAPVSLPYLAGLAIAWGVSTGLSYFFGRLG
jgi:hypothetical protein